jgi:hypothetical protein
MKPIKCLLLLAAVLAFVVMKADAVLDAASVAYIARVDAAAANSRLRPSEYVVQANEDGEVCWEYDNMGFEYCIWCCVEYSYDHPDNGVWLANRFAYETYGGRCICDLQREGTPAITPAQYHAATTKLRGEVIDLVAPDNRNDRNQK